MSTRWTEEEYLDYCRRTGQSSRIAPPAEEPEKRRNKYGAVKTWVDGICFDSKKEADYYCRLKLLVAEGEIDGFMYHGRMVVAEGTDREHRASMYEPDFVVLNRDGTCCVVDVKSTATVTPVFKTKIKALRARYPRVEIKLEV